MNAFRLPDEAHIGGVQLRVQNLDRALAFYRDILGFNVEQVNDSTVALSADGAPIIRLTAHADAVPKPRRSTGLYHVAILMPNRAALGKVLYRLLTSSWQLEGASDHLVSEALYLSDADGNGLEIYADRPREVWKFVNAQVAMATEPLDLDDLLQNADKSAWTGIPAGTIIGHVHLHVSDLAQAEAFYAGVLGLDVMQRSYPGALFLAAGGYHHHLGANIWAGRTPPPPNAVGLEWFSLAIPGHAAWMTLVERVESADIAISERGSDYALIYDGDGNGVRLARG